MSAEVVQQLGSPVWELANIGGEVGGKAASLDELGPFPGAGRNCSTTQQTHLGFGHPWRQQWQQQSSSVGVGVYKGSVMAGNW